MGIKDEIRYVLDEDLGPTITGIHVAIIVLGYVGVAILLPFWFPFYLIGRYTISTRNTPKEQAE